jgi:hypothetical protein
MVAAAVAATVEMWKLLSSLDRLHCRRQASVYGRCCDALTLPVLLGLLDVHLRLRCPCGGDLNAEAGTIQVILLRMPQLGPKSSNNSLLEPTHLFAISDFSHALNPK